jgi:hypothetical protein
LNLARELGFEFGNLAVIFGLANGFSRFALGVQRLKFRYLLVKLSVPPFDLAFLLREDGFAPV